MSPLGISWLPTCECHSVTFKTMVTSWLLLWFTGITGRQDHRLPSSLGTFRYCGSWSSGRRLSGQLQLESSESRVLSMRGINQQGHRVALCEATEDCSNSLHCLRSQGTPRTNSLEEGSPCLVLGFLLATLWLLRGACPSGMTSFKTYMQF